MTAAFKDSEIAYLGPEGSFSHMVAQQRYPNGNLIACRTVPEVFEFIRDRENGKGVVPIENSSGGLIVTTVDGLMDNSLSVIIEEELSIDVKLALLGRKGAEIRTVFSHFAPLHHCEPFLKANFPNAKTVVSLSTSSAAEEAAMDSSSAAIGPIVNAEIYGLDVLAYPIQKEVANVTQFFVVGHTRQNAEDGGKTALIVGLPNQPGGLIEFLRPFAEGAVNLTRIQSRPIVGQPDTHRFLIEIKGTINQESVKRALEAAEAKSTQFYNLGSYPVLPRYQSREA